MTPDTAAVVLAAALPEPGPDAVYARLDARRAALTVLGDGTALHGQPTEELVARARTRLADEAAEHVGEHTCTSTHPGVAGTWWHSSTHDCPVRQRWLAGLAAQSGGEG